MADLPVAQGQIPQSNALAEASADSLSELFSRDPEGLSDQDLFKVVTRLREARVTWKNSETAALSAPKEKKAVASKAASLIAKVNTGDLGL